MWERCAGGAFHSVERVGRQLVPEPGMGERNHMRMRVRQRKQSGTEKQEDRPGGKPG